MSYTHLDLLLRLIAAHAISDFFLQSKKWIDDRSEKKIKSRYLYLHTLLIFALSYLALGGWYPLWIPLVIALSHFSLDLIKSYIKKENTVLFIIDQVLHILIIIGCWLIYTKQYNVFSDNFIYQYYSPHLWFILTSYIIVTIPASIIMTKLTAKWSAVINNNGNNEGLQNAGKWIGIIERILVLSFAIIGKYEAIGFLLAAKSVFRFGDLREGHDRRRTEYILIGTLLSFSISIILGFIINYFK